MRIVADLPPVQAGDLQRTLPLVVPQAAELGDPGRAARLRAKSTRSEGRKRARLLERAAALEARAGVLLAS